MPFDWGFVLNAVAAVRAVTAERQDKISSAGDGQPEVSRTLRHNFIAATEAVG